MARKPKTLKPLLATKHDFVDSLDAVIVAAMQLVNTVDRLLELEQVKPEAAPLLKEARNALHDVLFTKD